jgi:hypothetical protein
MPRSLTDLVPTRLSARRRWRAKEARVILKHLDASGLSVREFAARYGLETQRLYRWRAQLASPAPAAAAPFVEIERPPGAAIEGGAAYGPRDSRARWIRRGCASTRGRLHWDAPAPRLGMRPDQTPARPGPFAALGATRDPRVEPRSSWWRRCQRRASTQAAPSVSRLAPRIRRRPRRDDARDTRSGLRRRTVGAVGGE